MNPISLFWHYLCYVNEFKFENIKDKLIHDFFKINLVKIEFILYI